MTDGSSSHPLLVVLGATGTGKSNLAVSLAKRFNGDIINADALQLYKGLPIATNKLPLEEREGVPHHLLGCIGFDEPTWTVGRFVQEATKKIQEIRSMGRTPVLVGGTSYYTQALLLQGRQLDTDEPFLSIEEMEKKWPILRASDSEILEELKRVDPNMAARWHPKDTRKIRRSLEIWLQTGKIASETYEEQQSRPIPAPSESETDNSFRRKQTGKGPLILWIYSDPKILDLRIAKRIDAMVGNGLLPEIQFMRSEEKRLRASGEVDISRGIWVAIGYKEFSGYLDGLEAGDSTTQLEPLMNRGLELTNIATRQYSKRQIKWIKCQLLPKLQEAGLDSRMFVLDGTSLEDWSLKVEGMALDIVEAYLEGRPLPDNKTTSDAASAMLGTGSSEAADKGEPLLMVCDLCDVTTTTKKDGEAHLKSKKHKALLRRQRNPERQIRLSTRNAEQ